LTIGLWVLAALMILWYNGAAVTSLLDQPLSGLSPAARETLTKWQRLEIRVASQLKEIFDPQEIDKVLAVMDFKKVKAILPAKKSKPVPVAITKALPVKRKEVVLPTLSGVMAIYDADGVAVHLAVVDGQAREEWSRIGDFVIERIDAKGVLLTQDRDSWFIPAPRVDFSLDTSEGGQSTNQE